MALPGLAGLLLTTCLYCLPELSKGSVKTEDRAVSGFHRLDISGSFTVELSQGNLEQLKIEADEEIMANIITEVKNGELKIYTKGKIIHKPVRKIYLTIKDLDGITSSGAIVLKGAGTLKLSSLELDLSGSADIELDLNTANLEADLSGSTKMVMQGSATKMKLDISGSGNMDAGALLTETTEIEISGSGNATVNVSRELEVEISGAGDVVYKGNPDIKKSISGAGTIKKLS